MRLYTPSGGTETGTDYIQKWLRLGENQSFVRFVKFVCMCEGRLGGVLNWDGLLKTWFILHVRMSKCTDNFLIIKYSRGIHSFCEMCTHFVLLKFCTLRIFVKTFGGFCGLCKILSDFYEFGKNW